MQKARVINVRKDIHEILRQLAHDNYTTIVDEADKILRKELIQNKGEPNK